MTDFSKMSISGICQAKKGLMFLRDCGAPAVATCDKCARPVCQNHHLTVEGKSVCPECYTSDQPQASDQSAVSGTGMKSVSRYRTRHGYYSRFHYTPYYFGRSHYYSDRDYRTFDETPGQEGAGVGEAAMMAAMVEEDTGDYDDLDDFMES